MKNDILHRLNAGFPGSKRHWKSCFWLLAFLIGWGSGATLLKAQQPVAASKTTQQIGPPNDSLRLLYVYAHTPERATEDRDTLPDARFRMYDPARQQKIDYGALGNLGTPNRPLFYEARARRGFDLGIHGYDLYQLQPNELRFYQNTRSFSEVYFSQGGTQFDGLVNAKYSRTFDKGVVFSLDYRAINNLGQYQYQRSRHNGLSLGVLAPISDRYTFFLIFTKNVMSQQENGGIADGATFGTGQFSGPISADIRLPNKTAATRISNQVVQFTQYLNFTRAATGKRVFRAEHTLSYAQNTFKFSDAPLNGDTLFYEKFLVDKRGIRQYVSYNRLDNQINLSTFKSRTVGQPSDLLTLGLSHSYFTLNQELADSAFSNFFITGNLSITPSERFRWIAKGSLGILGNLGEYQLESSLRLGLGALGEFRAGVTSQLYPPALLDQRLYVSKRLIWNNDFKKPLENSLWAAYALPSIGFEAMGRTYLLNNYIYADQDGFAQQTGAPLQIVQVLITENLKIGAFRLDNTVAYQRANRTDIFRLPNWFTKHSAYFDGRIFRKRMQFSAGVDFRMNQEFRPDAYQPITGQFHLQDSLKQAIYPWLDVFVAFKVSSFRFFIRMENMGNLWNNSAVFYQTANYPLPFRAIRFGINWRFMDLNTKATSTTNGGAPGRNSSRPPGNRGF